MKNLFLGALVLASASAFGNVVCEVTAVDQTPVYFLGPSGSFPHIGSSIELDLSQKELTDNLGTIPLKKVGAKLVRNEAVEAKEGTGVVYFDGEFVSPTQATYTAAISVAPEGAGKLQVARRGFKTELELYNAVLKCTPKS